MGAINNRPSLSSVETIVSSTLKIYGTARNVSSSPYVPHVVMSCKYSLNGHPVHTSSSNPFGPVSFDCKHSTTSCCNRSAHIEIPILLIRYATADNWKSPSPNGFYRISCPWLVNYSFLAN